MLESKKSGALRSVGGWSTLCLLAALPGCGGATPDQGPGEAADKSVDTVSQAVDPLHCPTALITCIQSAKNFTDLATCNQTYTSCVAADLVPPVVTTTVNALNTCQAGLSECAGAAKTPIALATCQVQEVTCAGQALAAPVTTAVAAGAACVDAAAVCTGKATTAAGIAACGQTFTTCVTSAALTPVLPPIVTDAVTAVTKCADTLTSCVAGAKTPADITTCTTNNVLCVGAAVGVPVQDVTAAVTCADATTKCVLAAKSPSDLTSCGDTFAACEKELAPKSPVNCDIAFTQCVAANPFNFFQCADTSRQCHIANP